MTPAGGSVLWQAHRRPHGRMLAWVLGLGFLLAAFSTALIRSLMIVSDPLLGGAVGGAVGLFLVFSLYQGSSVRVERGARLVYSLRNHDCISVDLRRVNGLRHVSTGVLAGIGLACPVDALTFLSRKGPSRRHCEATHAHLGLALILEFLRPEDLEPLCAACKASLE